MGDGSAWSDHGDRPTADSADSVEALAKELYEASGFAGSLRDKYRKQAEKVLRAGGAESGHLLDKCRKQAETATRLQSKAATPTRSQVTEGNRTGETLLILVRHARRTRETARSEQCHRMEGWPKGRRPSPQVEEDDGKSTRKSGWKKTLDIAISLAEQLDVEGVRVSHIVYSEHEVATQTAKVYAAALCRLAPPFPALRPEPWLTPKTFPSSREEINNKIKKLEAEAEGQSGGQAIILVGHQPQLTMIADAVLRETWW